MPKYDKLLVLDLDETLIFSQWLEDEKIKPDFVSYAEEGDDLPVYPIYKRPGLDNFLEFCFENFEVGVWSSAPEDYVNGVCDFIFKGYAPKLIWSRNHCDSIGGRVIKDIKKLEKPYNTQQSRILAVDDNPEHYLDDAIHNLVKISRWEGELKDDSLTRLSELLESIGPVHDVRRVFWSRSI